MDKGHGHYRGLVTALERATRARRQDETSSERWRRFYGAEGGPLMAWLLEESAGRRLDAEALARELGVDVEYRKRPVIPS